MENQWTSVWLVKFCLKKIPQQIEGVWKVDFSKGCWHFFKTKLGGISFKTASGKRSHSDCWNIHPRPFSRSPHVLGLIPECIVAFCWVGVFHMPRRNSSWPGDSKWPFYPLVTGHLTIPKRAQGIAGGVVGFGGAGLATWKVWKFFFRHFHKERFQKHWSCQAGHLKQK